MRLSLHFEFMSLDKKITDQVRSTRSDVQSPPKSGGARKTVGGEVDDRCPDLHGQSRKLQERRREPVNVSGFVESPLLKLNPSQSPQRSQGPTPCALVPLTKDLRQYGRPGTVKQ
jgi:hypothetical protein